MRREEEQRRKQKEHKRREKEEQGRKQKELENEKQQRQRIKEMIRNEEIRKRHELLDKEIQELQIKFPNLTYRNCLLRLCMEYHPDKNPNIDPEYIKLITSMMK